MKAHLTERSVKGLQPKAKNIIVYDEEVVGFGVRITSGGTRAFILTYRIEARERRLTIGAWPDWSVTAAREEAKRLKREIDQGRDPMAERDEARESPNVRQLIDRYLEEHASKLAKRSRCGCWRGREGRWDGRFRDRRRLRHGQTTCPTWRCI